MNDPKILKLEKRIRELEKLIPNVLWEGDTNDVSQINLSDSIENYNRIKIYYYDNNWQNLSVEINNKKSSSISTCLMGIYNSGKWFNIKMKSITINGKLVSNVGFANYEFSDNSIIYNNNINITKIEGYKI